MMGGNRKCFNEIGNTVLHQPNRLTAVKSRGHGHLSFFLETSKWHPRQARQVSRLLTSKSLEFR